MKNAKLKRAPNQKKRSAGTRAGGNRAEGDGLLARRALFAVVPEPFPRATAAVSLPSLDPIREMASALTIILGRAEAIMQQAQDEATHQHLASIIKQAERIARLRMEAIASVLRHR